MEERKGIEEENTIELQDVCKMFEKETILKNVNLICKKGSITGIIGRNGSGKTVLFKCICGFFKTGARRNLYSWYEYKRKKSITVEK